jgi:hypothetical protein
MTDNPEWFKSPEHAHVVGLDNDLAQVLRQKLGIAEIDVDCGVEGDRSYTYHFRLQNVPAELHGHACALALDYLSSCTPYRFETQCV